MMPTHLAFTPAILRLIALAALALVAAGCGLAGEPAIVATVPPALPTAQAIFAEPADLALGAQIYAANCTACHGQTGLGDGPSVLSGAVPMAINFAEPATLSITSPQEAFTVITEGRLEKLMPPWGNILSAGERWAAANYVYRLRDGLPADLLASAAEAAAPAPLAETIGTISGALVMGSGGMAAPEPISVALQTLSLDFQEVGFEMAQASGGRYQFEAVPMRADRMYVITALYDEHVFASPLLSGDPAVAALDVPLTLYATTDDPSVVQITLAVTRIEPEGAEGKEARITQVINFHNTSDRAFVRPNVAKMRDEAGYFSLPAGATLLNEAELADCCIVENGMLFDNRPLLPGDDHMFRAVYTLPQADLYTLPFAFDFPVVNQLELMLAPGAYTLQSGPFAAQGVQQFSTGAYDVYLAPAQAPGARTEAVLAPATSSNAPSLAALAPWIGGTGGLLVLGALVLAVWPRFRKRGAAQPMP